MKTRIIFFIYLHLTVAFGETQGERRDCKMHVFVTNLIYHIWCRVCRGFFVLVGNIQLSGFHPTLPMYEWWKLNLDWDPFIPPMEHKFIMSRPMWSDIQRSRAFLVSRLSCFSFGTCVWFTVISSYCPQNFHTMMFDTWFCWIPDQIFNVPVVFGI